VITSCDAAWFAGLLEGEGCFSMSSTGGGKYSSGVSIRLVMTDQDTVERAARLFGAVAHKQMSPSHMKSGRKPIWRVGVHGRRAAEWMMTVYCLLGARRQAKVRELLAWWKTSRGAYSLRTTCPNGHIYSVDNTYVYEGRRTCRECKRGWHRRQAEAKRRVRAEATAKALCEL